MPRRKKPVEPEPEDTSAPYIFGNRGVICPRVPGYSNPAVYKSGDDYFCAPDEGETLHDAPLFAKGWQLIAIYKGREIHRARG